MDENKNPSFHRMTHEMRSIILNKYEQDTSERKQLLEKLAAGEYPSLSWMDDDPILRNEIKPGQQLWPPVTPTGTPPHGFEKEKPSSSKQSMADLTGGFLSRMKEIATMSTTNAVKKPTSITIFTRSKEQNNYHSISLAPATVRECTNGYDVLEKAFEIANSNGSDLFYMEDGVCLAID